MKNTVKKYVETEKDPWRLLTIGMDKERKKEIIKFIGKAGNVIDIGGGFGFYSETTRMNGNRVTCLDFSKRMVTDGKKMFPKVNFILSDGCKMPIKNNSMDAILCMGTLIYIENKKKFIIEIHRVLKKNGKLVLIERNKNYMISSFVRIFKETEQYVDNTNHFLTKKEIKTLLKGTFRIKKIKGTFSNFLICISEKID